MTCFSQFWQSSNILLSRFCARTITVRQCVLCGLWLGGDLVVTIFTAIQVCFAKWHRGTKRKQWQGNANTVLHQPTSCSYHMLSGKILKYKVKKNITMSQQYTNSVWWYQQCWMWPWPMSCQCVSLLMYKLSALVSLWPHVIICLASQCWQN